MTDPAPEHSGSRCPFCGSTVAPDAAFCEACGKPLTPTGLARGSEGVAPLAEHPVLLTDDLEAPIELSRATRPIPPEHQKTIPVTRPCSNCGGVIGADGYCETCGMKAPTERDHYTEQPAMWVAACCDRGVRHHRNEDATATAAETELGSRAVLVVCDGVSTSIDSDLASLAGAHAARDHLMANRPSGLGTPASHAAAMSGVFEQAAAEANAAVIAYTAPNSENAASCTFSAAVIDGSEVYYGNVGDSRSYWIPDLGSGERPVQLSVDDSVAQARIEMGVPREEAENGPQAHAITKWLGRDSPDFSPMTGSLTVRGPGWLLVCSDGLWNYASPAEKIQQLIADLVGSRPDPLPLSVALVRWANEQGGKDNIAVALARHEGGVDHG